MTMTSVTNGTSTPQQQVSNGKLPEKMKSINCPEKKAISTIMSKTRAIGMTLSALLLLLVLCPSQSFLPTPRTTLREATNGIIPRRSRPRKHAHIIPPPNHPGAPVRMTLRKFLLHPDGFHLALAPAFFGFFAQFGIMQAWDEGMSKENFNMLQTQIKSLAGSSAGAMTAVLVGAGIEPKVAAAFCETISLDAFADPFGVLALFKGDLFLKLMQDFMKKQAPDSTLILEDSKIPVAVTAYDLRSAKGKILTKGDMALAARASACFPFLFEPVQWTDADSGDVSYFIDGGIRDMWGLEGLAAFPTERPKRVVNLVVGSYPSTSGALGPSDLPVDASQVLSISIQNTPQSGPWAMENGPRAVKAATAAMLASLDLPLYMGKEQGHYELHIDATKFVPPVR